MDQVLTKKNNKNNLLKLESEYFIQNGGILLEKCIALSQGKESGAWQVKILSNVGVQNTTDCYEPNVILRSRVNGTVYKGYLDEHVIAIKISKDLYPAPELMNFYFTEASAKMVMKDENMLKLYGCCLEAFKPILVYKFTAKNNFFKHLYCSFPSGKSLKWADCLRLATDVSYALSYKLDALSKPLEQGRSASIYFLATHSMPKLSYFGYSVSITPGDKSERWLVLGTTGYIDLEYVETQR